MSDRRYTAKELRAMSLKDLDAAGKDLGLAFTKNHNRAERSRRILAAYAEQDVQVSIEEGAGDSPSKDPPTQGGPKPDFEQLITSEPVEEVTHTPSRGGARPGAGRPEGMTNEIAEYNRLVQQPHPAIKQTITMLFDAWSVRVQCPAVKLSEDEAFDLALPWTQAAELTGIAQRIPPWLMVVLSCVWTTSTIVKCKAALAREAVARKEKQNAGSSII